MLFFLDHTRLYEADRKDQKHRKSAACQHAGTHIVRRSLCDHTDHDGTDGCTEIAAHGKQRKQPRAAERHFPCGNTDGTGPHDADRKAAQNAADKPENGRGGQCRQKIAQKAQDARAEHIVRKVDLLSVFSVDHTAYPHSDRKHARSRKVADAF